MNDGQLERILRQVNWHKVHSKRLAMKKLEYMRTRNPFKKWKLKREIKQLEKMSSSSH